MKILISGGCGFIGLNLVRRLVDLDHDVTVIDNLLHHIHPNPKNSITSLPKSVHFLKIDISNRNDFHMIADDYEVLVHLASETGTGQSMYEFSNYVDSNIVGTANLLNKLLKSKSMKKIIVASSRAIYGEGTYYCNLHKEVYPSGREEKDLVNGIYDVRCPLCKKITHPIATREDSKLDPISIYATTKLSQEQLIHQVCSSSGLDSIALRFQNVFGPGQSLNNPYTGILSIFSSRILNKNKVVIFEDGKESRDFVFIDDVVQAIVASVNYRDKVNDSFNIGTGVSTSVERVARQLHKIYGAKENLSIDGSFRKGDIRHNFADITKAKEVLDWTPNITFDEGLQSFANWVKEQEIPQDNFNKSINELKKFNLYVQK